MISGTGNSAATGTRSFVRRTSGAATARHPATVSNASVDSDSTSFGKALTTFFASISTPITPVEAGRISTGFAFSALAAAFTQVVATFSPVRVAQFALPALMIQARDLPREVFRFWRASTTGAATTLFCVNTAADEAALSDTISATSFLATLRMPA